MEYRFLLLIPLIAIGACSGTGASYEPKLAAAAKAGYETDLAECRALAKSEKPMNAETRTRILIGSAAGALAGADDGNAGAGAVVGAAAGAVSGAADTRFTRKEILLECLRQRGQPVAG